MSLFLFVATMTAIQAGFGIGILLVLKWGQSRKPSRFDFVKGLSDDLVEGLEVFAIFFLVGSINLCFVSLVGWAVL